LLIVATVFIVAISSSTTMVRGKEVCKSSDCTADAYIDSSDPTTNFGATDYNVYCGGFSNDYEAWFKFDVSDAPDDWTEAKFSFELFKGSATVNLSIAIAPTTWTESGITYMNAPDKWQTIGKVLLTGDGAFELDVSNYIVNDTLGLVLFVSPIDDKSETIFIYTRESSSDLNMIPSIVYDVCEDVKEEDDDNDISGLATAIGSALIVGFVVVVVIVGLIIALLIKKLRK